MVGWVSYFQLPGRYPLCVCVCVCVCVRAHACEGGWLSLLQTPQKEGSGAVEDERGGEEAEVEEVGVRGGGVGGGWGVSLYLSENEWALGCV